MFDLAWAELLVIGVVAVLAIGPKELPAVMRTIGRFVRRMQYMKFALSQQFDDFMQQQDLMELRAQAAKGTTAPESDEAEADEDFMEQLPLPAAEHPAPHHSTADNDDDHPRHD